jgi:hypothetical protein
MIPAVLFPVISVTRLNIIYEVRVPKIQFKKRNVIIGSPILLRKKAI